MSFTPLRTARRSTVIGWVAAVGLVLVLVAWVLLRSVGAGVGWPEAALLGVVEGITEYLPVSSTGHLTVLSELMWPGADPGVRAALDSYVIVIQAGAIIAVFGLYYRYFVDMVRGLFQKGPGRRLAVALLAAFVPAAVVGLVLGDWVKANLFGLAPIAWAWIVGGVAILVIERRFSRRDGDDLEALGVGRGLLVGAAQVLALWPGTSRSLDTILGGRAVGLSTRTAVEFSFLLGAVTLLAASGYEAVGNLGRIMDQVGAGPAVVGFVFATVAAAFSVKWLVSFLTRRSLEVFGWYRIIIGAGALFYVAV